MNERRDQLPRTERTRSTDTVASITAEIVGDLTAMKDEIGTFLDDSTQHEIKHALANRVVALQGAIDLLAREMGTCDHKDQCPLRGIVGAFVTPPDKTRRDPP